ncbi:MAG: sulfatase-like hydrolase/transferase, partial [Geminicoccaceae bacterium]|nr:sulfatase-like hydrolase/transferase [Geminicoccaceae bacterium]
MQRKNGEKPNIVLIEADQMTGLVLPIYDPKAQAITPHLTALAEPGLLFENAYCNSPLCTPSRASMFSGTRTTTNEV